MQLFTRRRRLALSMTAVATAGVAMTLTAGSGAAVAEGGQRDVNRIDHAYVIMLENHSQQGVIGDVNAPYLTHLAATYGNATNYYGVTHPSLPNYVASIAGSTFWVNNDDPNNRFDHTNIVDSLEQAHITWGAYMEAMPANDKTVDYWPSSTDKLYASKHNPFVLFTDIRSNSQRMENVKPYTDLAGDLNTGRTPKFVYIVPDQCNDMHGGIYNAVPGHPETPCPYGSTNDDPNDAALKQKADAFVQSTVGMIMGSKAWTPNSAIFIVADEGDYTNNAVNGGWDSPAGCCDSPVLPAGDPDISPSWPGGTYGGGKVPAIVVTGGHPQHVVDDTAYNHYSMLRTIEDAWHLPELGYTSDHAQVTTMDPLLGG